MHKAVNAPDLLIVACKLLFVKLFCLKIKHITKIKFKVPKNNPSASSATFNLMYSTFRKAHGSLLVEFFLQVDTSPI
jgi:hypothetical protein